MKLPDFLLDVEMNALRRAMGIPADQFGSFEANLPPNRLTLEELHKLSTGEGIDVNFSELTILSDGTLAYKNSRVLLYIRDHEAYQGEINPPRYHFYNCRTLRQMKDSGRFERYVVATEVTGSFMINIIEHRRHRTERFKLSVCQNCLNGLHFDGFTLRDTRVRRERYVSHFLPQKFFNQYPQSLLIAGGQPSAATAPVNDYPENWGEISRQARLAADWTCSVCGLVLQVHKKKYLHVHHRNGVRSDNRSTNLQVLCLGCHAEQPQHQRMKSTRVYSQFLRDTKWSPKRR